MTYVQVRAQMQLLAEQGYGHAVREADAVEGAKLRNSVESIRADARR